METFYTDHQSYATATSDATAADQNSLQYIEPALKNASDLKIDAKSPTGYTISVLSKGSDATRFSIKNTAGTITHDCTNHGKGGCPSDGNW
jgi:hypothetical protein